jgi:hypothetical protein
MEYLPEINDGLWIILFIIAGILGYRVLLQRLTAKKIAPTYIHVYSVEKIEDQKAKLTYEVGASSLIKIEAIIDSGVAKTIFEQEQKPGNYFLDFDANEVTKIKLVSDHQVIERAL